MRGKLTGLVCAALLVAGCSGGSTEGTATMSSTTSRAPVATSTVASQAERSREYGSEMLSPLLDRLGTSFTWIGAAMKSMDFADARAGCRDMAKTVDDMEAALPAPSREATNALVQTVANFRQFARECQSLNPSTSGDDLAGMTAYREQGEAALDRAIAALKNGS